MKKRTINNSSAILARETTRSSSKQSYYITRLLVDYDLQEDCYRAYAYFRWVDDCVDDSNLSLEKRIAFIERQIALVERFYKEEQTGYLLPHEEIIRDLIANDRGENSGLKSYIDNFMAILEFDAHRRDRTINQDELDWYSHTLAVAVTDAIQYFIHNGHPYLESEFRYLAANAAHITHMLRDMRADMDEGYINIPQEYLDSQGTKSQGMSSEPFRTWVRYRVKLARAYLSCGKYYLDGLDVLNCKIAGYWYCARFEPVLDRIELDDYLLRPVYSERGKPAVWLRMGWVAAIITCKHVIKKFLTGRTFNGTDLQDVEYVRSID
ncbi:squalene/phytoene synthase family protein [Chloroflexota bacterium]